jgi:putative NADH-flavin reductase
MKVIIFGASGKTGKYLVEQALTDGHEVTAFVRDESKLDIAHENLTNFVGDVLTFETVSESLEGQEIVICSLGTSDLGDTTLRTKGTKNIVEAMSVNDANRLFVISAMGVGESWKSLSFFSKALFATLLRSSRIDHEAQEEIVMNTNLDWTIVRPSGLMDTPITGIYDVGENIAAKTSRIARADVSDFIIKEIKNNSYVKKAITITN